MIYLHVLLNCLTTGQPPLCKCHRRYGTRPTATPTALLFPTEAAPVVKATYLISSIPKLKTRLVQLQQCNMYRNTTILLQMETVLQTFSERPDNANTAMHSVTPTGVYHCRFLDQSGACADRSFPTVVFLRLVGP